jgi:hypothetical protein
MHFSPRWSYSHWSHLDFGISNMQQGRPRVQQGTRRRKEKGKGKGTRAA